jgi:hypothetical protein
MIDKHRLMYEVLNMIPDDMQKHISSGRNGWSAYTMNPGGLRVNPELAKFPTESNHETQ